MNKEKEPHKMISRGDKIPRAFSKSQKIFPLVLVSSFILLVGSFISPIYYYLRGSKSSELQKNINANRFPEPIHMEGKVFEPVKHGNRQILGYAGIILAVFLALLAYKLLTTPISTIYPWLIHLASIVVLIISILWLDRTKKHEGLISNPWTWLEVSIFITILAIAIFMRLYQFDQIPFGTWYDEADNGLNALRILNETGYLPVFVESTNLPAHFLYMIALSFRLFGISTLSIRVVSVFFGLGTVAAAFLTGREFFNRKMGLLIAFFLAISRWDIIWSRFGVPGATVPFIELLVVGLLLRALRRQSLIDYTLAGLSLGFGLCFYFPLRLFPFVVGLFIVVLLLNRRDLIRSSWCGLIALSLGIIIAAIPVIFMMSFKSDIFWSRMQTASIFAGKTTQEGWQAVAKTTREHLLMFNFQGDKNGRHNLPGKPMLDPITGTLMVLGVGLSLWRIRTPKFFLILTWFILMLAPGIFSLDFESPQSLRAIGSLPAAYLLAAVPIEWIWQKSEKSVKKYFNYMFVADMVILLGMSTVINFNIYFHQQANSIDSWASFSTPETIAGKIMADLDNKVEYYVSSYYFQTPTIQFLAPKVTDYHNLETYETLPILSTSHKDMVFLLAEDQKLFFDQAQNFYPSAIFNEYAGPDGSTVLYEIYLSQADILASQGLTASYYFGENWSGEPFLVRTEKNLNFEWVDGEPASFPFSTEWTGIVFAPVYGNYKFVAQSPALLELIIDNVPVVFNGIKKRTGEISLAKGCHTIVIRTVGIAGRYMLEWQPPEENLEPIPQSVLLLPPFTTNGLLGQYYDNPNWEGSPVFTQIDPWISFYFHNPPLPRPYTIEWSGRIYISGGGNYYFGLESIDESSLWIDEKQIIDNKTPDLYQEAGIFLTPGFHPIRVLFTDRTGYTHIYLYWSPPNLEQAIIPQYVLFPPIGDP